MNSLATLAGDSFFAVFRGRLSENSDVTILGKFL